MCGKLLTVSVVANNDVTTAVDIYSFGMCALEVRWDQECLIDRLTWAFFSHSDLLTCCLVADGAFGNSEQRRLLVHFSGSHRQRHTVAGRPTPEGKMQRFSFVHISFGICVKFSFHEDYVCVLCMCFLGVDPEVPCVWSRYKAYSPGAALQPGSLRSASIKTLSCTLYCQPPAWVLNAHK